MQCHLLFNDGSSKDNMDINAKLAIVGIIVAILISFVSHIILKRRKNKYSLATNRERLLIEIKSIRNEIDDLTKLKDNIYWCVYGLEEDFIGIDTTKGIRLLIKGYFFTPTFYSGPIDIEKLYKSLSKNHENYQLNVDSYRFFELFNEFIKKNGTNIDKWLCNKVEHKCKKILSKLNKLIRNRIKDDYNPSYIYNYLEINKMLLKSSLLFRYLKSHILRKMVKSLKSHSKMQDIIKNNQNYTEFSDYLSKNKKG